jgi:hypothetical protein
MRAAFPDWSTLRASPSARRAASLVLTVLAHLLILLALLRSTNFQFQPPSGERRLVTVNIASEAQREAPRRRETVRRQAARAAPPPPPIPPPPPTPVRPPQPWVVNPELAGFDLSRTRSTPVERPAAQAADSGADSAGVYGPSDAPGGGGRLYEAEWYREPSEAELAFYMPRGVIGYGVIACRTVERFHVEDCREVSESPPGSRMASAVREAAWQFLVRPPRINGKPMIGAWVRIRISLTPEGRTRTR